MATISTEAPLSSARRLGVVRFALTGAIAAPVFFAFCWIGALLPFSPGTHMYLQLFTAAPMGSVTALAEGLCWSVAFGLITGALIAFIYNFLAPLDRD